MSDTDNPVDFASTLGEAVHSAMIRMASVLTAVEHANEALDAGDTDKAHLAIRNAKWAAAECHSVQSLIYACLPRTGDKPNGGMG